MYSKYYANNYEKDAKGMKMFRFIMISKTSTNEGSVAEDQKPDYVDLELSPSISTLLIVIICLTNRLIH